METKDKVIAVSYVLVGTLLQYFIFIADVWQLKIITLFGLIMMLIGLSRLKTNLDEPGNKGMSLLFNSAILSIVAALINFFPLTGILTGILFIIAYIMQIMAFISLKQSAVIGVNGINGAGLLLGTSVGAGFVNFIDLFPMTGLIVSIFSIVILIVSVLGWLKIQEGLMEKTEEAES